MDAIGDARWFLSLPPWLEWVEPTVKSADLATAASMAAASSLLVLGLGRSDCVLIASAAFAAQRALQVAVERHRPGELIRIATHYITAGCLGFLASILLISMVVGARSGWWPTAHEATSDTVVWIAVSALVLVVARRHWFGALAEASSWSVVLVGAFAAAQGAAALSLDPRCAFALVTAVVVGLVAWRQLRRIAPAYLRQAIAQE